MQGSNKRVAIVFIFSVPVLVFAFVLLPAILAVDYNLNNTQVMIWLISFLILTVATMAYFLFRKK